MKFLFGFILCLTLIGLSKGQGIGLSCRIEDSVKIGTNYVVITVSPSPIEVLEMAGLENSRSPAALINHLNSTLSSAFVTGQAVSAEIGRLVKTAFPIVKVPMPNCRFKWISSQLYCDNVPGSILQPLCRLFTAIQSITRPITFPLPTQPSEAPLACESNPRWGLFTVRAQEAWATGARGAGVVVANLDSGVRSTHDELKGNMRSNYAWFNPYDSKNQTPVDDTGHGTHTMGTICGKTVGVAPDATWIACKGCNSNGCGNEQLTDCGEWLMCPDRRGLNCTSKPHVINNSWGGGIGDTFYQSALALMKQVGIVNVFSTGNSGPACASVVSPADGNGAKWGFISVGATACNEKIGSYSSTGPSRATDYLGRLGVEVVAPGSNILSAWYTSDNGTNKMSGTSMSCPHVTGAVAVLLSRNPILTVDQLRNALESSAFQNPNITTSLTTCTSSNLTNAGPWPNNVYGNGRIDILAALNVLSL